MTFTAPAKSIQFLLNHSVDLDSILSLPAFSDVNRELIGDILTGAADFAENVWAPTNWDGDQNPATLNGDDVKASPGFKEAYEAFVEAAWALKDKYLPKMINGEWTGAMCLTEPQAGSDLGPVRTKAVDNGDGTYAISGQKIYITWGDHDVADNIIHLVLARLPDAPAANPIEVCPVCLL